MQGDRKAQIILFILMFLNNIYLPEQSIFLPFNLSTSSFNLSHISGYALNSLHKDGSDPVLCLYFPFCQNLLSNPVHKELNVWKELLKKKKRCVIKLSLIVEFQASLKGERFSGGGSFLYITNHIL